MTKLKTSKKYLNNTKKILLLQKRFKMEKESKIAKSLKLDKEIFDAVVDAAKRDKRSVNSEIQILLMEALEHRKKTSS